MRAPRFFVNNASAGSETIDQKLCGVSMAMLMQLIKIDN
jgi:hypothetical protein